MKQLYFFIIILFLNFPAFSQNIRGKVTDKSNGQAIAGAVVDIPELSKGTVTDKNGNFVLGPLPKGNFKLEVSMLGYKTKVMEITTPMQKTLSVQLEYSMVETEKVVVTGGYFSPTHTNAVKVHSISLSNTITADNKLSNFLTEVPGVDLISKGNGVTKPVIRGLSGTNILVLRNGFRLENFQFSENHPFLTDAIGSGRIEIIKGPASLLYGSDAIGGVINFLPEKPAQSNKTMIDFSNTFFSNGNGFVQNFGLKSSSKKFMYGIRLGNRMQKDFTDALGRQVPNTRYIRQLAKFFAIYQSTKSITKFYYDFSLNKLGLAVGPALPLVSDNNYQPSTYYQLLHDNFAAFKHMIFLGKSNLKINLSYENNHRCGRNFGNVALPISMDLQTLNYETKFETHKNKLMLITGLQGYSMFNKNDLEAKTKILPNYKLFSNGAFIMAKLNIFGDAFIQSGIRYEYTNVIIPSQEYYDLFSDTKKMDFSNLSYSAGATYKFNKWNFRANFATGYRMPNMSELTQRGIHAFRYERGNFNLKSQRSFETDISVHYHTSNLMFDFSSFYNKIKNYIFLSPTDDTLQGFSVYEYKQDNALLYGFETGLEFGLKNFSAKATYAYIVGKHGNDFLPLIPQNKLKTRLLYKFGKTNNFTLQLENIYSFAKYDVAFAELPAPAYDLINLKIKYDAKKFQLSLGIDNLANTKYNDHLSTLKDIGYFDEGRNIYASLRIPLVFNYNPQH